MVDNEFADELDETPTPVSSASEPPPQLFPSGPPQVPLFSPEQVKGLAQWMRLQEAINKTFAICLLVISGTLVFLTAFLVTRLVWP